MVHLYTDITERIGRTPIVELTKIEKTNETRARIFAKLEYLNPAGSVKDRVAKAMIEDAEARGVLSPGALIVEPTSGNTGIGLALIAAAKGYRLILTMPETMSAERRNILKALGAQLVLTDGAAGMRGAIEKANEIVAKNPGAFLPGQFDNPANPRAHYETTGPEIWEDMDGKVDVFVAGVGTGGTLSGVGKYLREKNPAVTIIAVEPDTSAVLSGEAPGAHKIQGIGAGFIPATLDTGIYDEVIRVDNEAPFVMARELAKKEGIQVGISSGAALYAAVEIAKREDCQGKHIVVVLPDSGDRYYSTAIYMEE